MHHIAQHRHHQAHAFGFHRQADVDLLAFDDAVFMLVHGVDPRVFLDR